MIPLQEAIRRLSKQKFESEEIQIEKANGRILATDVKATVDLPEWPLAAMDGIAVKWKDVMNASEANPIKLEIIGSIDAGNDREFQVQDCQCVRINTGAIVPSQLDAVIKIEDVELQYEGKKRYAVIRKPVKKSKDVIVPGEITKKGDIIAKKGKILKPVDISLFKTLRMETVKVKKKPNVGILNTGDELVEKPPVPRGKVIESNSIMLVELMKSYATPIHFGFARDKAAEIEQQIKDALRKVDVLLIIGGTSKGTKDLVPMVLDNHLSATKIFHGVSISPGKPVGAWKIEEKTVFTLPGYPVACYITFQYIVKRFLFTSLEVREKDRDFHKLQTTLGEEVKSKKGKKQFVRVLLKNGYAMPLAKKGASNLASLAQADAILVIPEDITQLNKGEKVIVDLIL